MPLSCPPGFARQAEGKAWFRCTRRQLAQAFALPDVEEKLRQLGSDGVGDTPEHFGAFVRAELDKYRKLIAKAGNFIKLPRISTTL